MSFEMRRDSNLPMEKSNTLKGTLIKNHDHGILI